MKGLSKIVTENKSALFFLLKFVILYFLLNTIYGMYVEYYSPQADPFTIMVSNHTYKILSWFHEQISILFLPNSRYVGIQWHGKTVINVFEGCNGINVWIVFTVFLIAFSPKWYQSWKFLAKGTLIIYGINLIRVLALFWVAYFFPDSLYLFHKFFFTGIIYAMVFGLWLIWINKIRERESGTSTD